jgi:CRISPR-associated protein Csx10
MKAITYRIRLIEPVLVTQVQSGEENSAIGLPFVPGSALRGVFIDRYRRLYPAADLAADPTARRLFFDDAVCFLHAYPWLGNIRLVPTPLSWQTEKDNAGADAPEIFDFAVDDTKQLKLPKPVKGAFCSLGKAPALYTPAIVSSVHIGLSEVDVRGKGNAVYRYDALAAGEVLASVVLVQDDADTAVLEQLITPGEVMLGGAHLAGYGRAAIEDVQVKRRWEEVETSDEESGATMIITLLSDTLVRGAHGQLGGDLTAALTAALKLAPEHLHLDRSYQRLRPIGGYNRKWSLPLPQGWAIQAGSVFIYKAAGLDQAKVRALAQHGIGERRAEGFGRFVVSAQSAASFRGRTPKLAAAPAEELSASSKALAQRMANRRLELLLERELMAVVNMVEFNKTPSNAQLSRVRRAAQQAQHDKNLKPITDLLDDLKSAQKHDFEKARLRAHNDVSLLQWTRERAEQGDVDVQLIHGASLPMVAGERAVLTDEQRVIYTARLVDGIMRQATKANQRREESR